MNQIVLASAPRLTYFRDPVAVEAALSAHPEAESAFDQPIGARCLADHDHLVLATDTRSGRILAALGADEGATFAETFVMLITWWSDAAIRGPRLARRMAAMMLLRIAGMHAMPHAIAAPAEQTVLRCILAELDARLRGGVLFPGLGGKVIPLHAASFARRIARGIGRERRPADAGFVDVDARGSRGGRLALRSEVPVRHQSEIPARAVALPAVLDLRAIPETMLLDDARRLYQQR